MPQQPVGNKGPPTAWGPHSSHKLHVHHLPEGVVTPIPTSVVTGLSQQLKRRLCPKHLLGRHVEIINENHTVLANLGPKHTLLAFVQAAVHLCDTTAQGALSTVFLYY
jgi:hypothetical protein